MKKQLFILVLALVAGVTMSFGQTTSSLPSGGAITPPTPRGFDVGILTSDALHPVAGTPYTYSVTVPNPSGTKSYKWIVTQEQTFLTTGVLNTTNAESVGGTHIAAAGAELNATTVEPATSGEDIVITWKSFIHDPAKPVFVVIYVENNDATCVTQNVKVYQIEPVNSFTLDIANVQIDGTVTAYGTDYSTCVSNIASAVYSAGGVVYDFGTDYLFYTITAANFTGSWALDMQLAGLASGQTATLDWAYSNAPNTWTAYTLGTPATVNAQDPTGTVGAAGECIIVRVTVAHQKEEVLAAQTVTLSVDGISNTLPDLHYVTGLADGFTNDLANHIMKPRPTIQSTTTGTGVNFLPNK